MNADQRLRRRQGRRKLALASLWTVLACVAVFQELYLGAALWTLLAVWEARAFDRIREGAA